MVDVPGSVCSLEKVYAGSCKVCLHMPDSILQHDSEGIVAPKSLRFHRPAWIRAMSQVLKSRGGPMGLPIIWDCLSSKGPIV